MRKSKQEAAETRRRIVSVAAREFNKSGIDRTGVADVMTAAGLTVGGFYKHFSSKDQLVAEALGGALQKSLDSVETKRGGDLEAIAAGYLSRQHRDSLESSCPLPSVGSELRLAENDARQAISKGVERFISIIQACFPDLPPKEAKPKAHAILSAMVGAMVLSRIVTEPKLSDRLLRDTKEFVTQV
jgi:TetR/AcrR family transcriptional regulator, transcriptional repressor for nem operon